MKPQITIGACWDGREYYPPEYVNVLYRSCLRNTSIPFDFVLYTGPEAEKPGHKEMIDPDIRIVATGLPFWWCGIPFWQETPPGIETDSLLYLDLDQVIVGDLDDLIRFPSQHAYMKDYPAYCCPPGRERDGNASVTLIRNGAGSRIWECYIKAGCPVWDPISPPAGRSLPLAVQTIVNEGAGVPHDVFPEVWVSSFRLWVSKFGLPADCRIVSFHGQPKPAACLDIPWVRENWYE